MKNKSCNYLHYNNQNHFVEGHKLNKKSSCQVISILFSFFDINNNPLLHGPVSVCSRYIWLSNKFLDPKIICSYIKKYTFIHDEGLIPIHCTASWYVKINCVQ